MPRFPRYEQRLTRSQQENAFWEDPATVLGLARQAGAQVEQEQQHALQNELNQQQFEQRVAESDWRMAQQQLKTDLETRKSAEATGAYAALSELDPAAPDYRQKFAQVVTQYPLGVLNPQVQGVVKEYDRAHSHSIDSIRKAYGLGEDFDPTTAIRQTDDGRVTWDADTLARVGRETAMRRSSELADVRAQQAKDYQDRGFGDITATQSGVTAKMKDTSADDAKLKLTRLKDAERRRQDALKAIQGPNFRYANATTKEAMNRELTAANQEYGSVYQDVHGAPWQAEPNVTVPEGRGAGESAAVRGELNQSASEQPAQNVRVVAPDGRRGTIPASQLEEAMKAGYKQVQ